MNVQYCDRRQIACELTDSPLHRYGLRAVPWSLIVQEWIVLPVFPSMSDSNDTKKGAYSAFFIDTEQTEKHQPRVDRSELREPERVRLLPRLISTNATIIGVVAYSEEHVCII